MKKVVPLETRPEVDWGAVERLYRAGRMSVRTIAAKHGTKPSTIISRAKRGGWVQGAQATKRQVVADAMAGVVAGMKPEDVKRSQEKAIAEDLEDMDTGLQTYRTVLKAMRHAADQLGVEDPDPKTADIIVKTADKAVDGIRKIRGLDDPKKLLNQEELNAILAELEDHRRPAGPADAHSTAAGR
jgi:hypothetical protein